MSKNLFVKFSFLALFIFLPLVSSALAPLTPSVVQTKITTINSSLITVETNLNSAINTFKSAIPNSETTLWTPSVITAYTTPFLTQFQSVKATITSYIPTFSGCTTRECQDLYLVVMNGPLIQITEEVLNEVKELQGLTKLILMRRDKEFSESIQNQIKIDLDLYSTADKTTWTATQKTELTTLKNKLTDLTSLRSAFLLLWEPQTDKLTFVKNWITGSILQPSLSYHDFTTFNTKFTAVNSAYTKFANAVTALNVSVYAFKAKMGTPVQLTLNISSITTKRESTTPPYPVGYWNFSFNWTTKTLSPYELYYYTKLPAEAERNDKWQLLKKDIMVSDSNPYFYYNTFSSPSYTALQDPAESGKMICFKVKAQNLSLESGAKCVTPNVSVNTGVFINKTVPNFASSNITERSASFSWGAVEGAVGYAIYRNGELVKVTTERTYVEEPILMPGTPYTYVARPLNILTNVPEILDETAPTSLVPTKSFFAKIYDFFLGEEVSAATGDAKAEIVTLDETEVEDIGIQKILAITVKFKNTGLNETDTNLSVKQKLFDDQNSVAQFYKQNSFGKLTIAPVGTGGSNVAGPYTLDKTDAPAYKLDSLGLLEFLLERQIYEKINKKFIDANPNLKLNDYDIVVYVFPDITFDESFPKSENINESYELGGIFIGGIASKFEYAHEIGYAIGWYSARGLSCPKSSSRLDACYSTPLLDNLDVMGGLSYVHLDPLRKRMARWVEDVAIRRSGKYIIRATELSDTALRPITLENGVQIYFDYRDTQDAFLENSSIQNFDFNPNAPKGVTAVKFVITEDFGIKNFHQAEDEELRDKGFSHRLYIGSPFNEGQDDVKNFDFTSGSLKDGTGLYFSPTADLLVIQLSHTNTQSEIFVHYDQKPQVTAKLNSDGKTATVSWYIPFSSELNEVDAGGYRLYRKNVTVPSSPRVLLPPGNKKLTFHDASYVDDTIPANDTNEYEYTLEPYDAFIELPGKEYPTLPSDPSNSIKLGTLPTPTPTPITLPSTSICKITSRGTYPNGTKFATYSINMAGQQIYNNMAIFSDNVASANSFGATTNISPILKANGGSMTTSLLDDGSPVQVRGLWNLIDGSLAIFKSFPCN